MSKQPLPAPKPLVNLPCRTGEGPLWHSDEKKLYWTDIPDCKLYRCRDDGSELEEFDTGVSVGGFTFQAEGGLLLFMAAGAVKTWRDGEFTGTIIEEIPDERDSRFNDVITDPLGRVYCGTMSSPRRGGRLYRLGLDGELRLMRDNMKTPNGMGFSPDQKYFYQNDSSACHTYRYVYHFRTGEIRDREIIFATTADSEKGRPDGLTVDSEGCLWTARWDGGRVVRHDSGGEPFEEILFPVRKVSSLTIAGSDHRTAFFTTAGGDDRDSGQGELAGSVFHAQPMPAPGIPESRSRIRI